MKYMFLEYASEHGQPTPWEYKDAAAIGKTHVGMPLKISSAGLLEKASGTTAPTYLCMHRGMVESGDQIPVVPVHKGRRYFTVATEAIAAPVRGTKYTIAADGTGITATTASGVAALDGWQGASIAAGDEIVVVL